MEIEGTVQGSAECSSREIEGMGCLPNMICEWRDICTKLLVGHDVSVNIGKRRSTTFSYIMIAITDVIGVPMPIVFRIQHQAMLQDRTMHVRL